MSMSSENVVPGDMTLRFYGDLVLATPTSLIDEIDPSLGELAEAMLEMMYASHSVGLAANQVGVSKRMFVYDIGEGPNVVINPRITERSGKSIWDEGCLSFGEVFIDTQRAAKVHLEGMNLEGHPITIDAEDYLAEVLQHEVDHLDGKTMLDRTSREKALAAKIELKRQRVGAS